jgi:hypothetical protein
MRLRDGGSWHRILARGNEAAGSRGDDAPHAEQDDRKSIRKH